MNISLTADQQKNKLLWDVWSRLHIESEFYDVQQFKAGKCSLKELDRSLLGNVTGKKVLHLQCHFGLDSISLSRLGAQVTGLDFSDVAINYAKELARDCTSDARFVVGDAEDLGSVFEPGSFDLVYASYGVISWLESLGKWANGISSVLRPGGEFVLVELHPFLGMLSDDGDEFIYSYFESGPDTTTETSSYAGCSHEALEIVQWGHSLGDVLSSLAGVGVFTTSFAEYPYSTCNCYSYFEETQKGRFVAKQFPVEVPHMFSIRGQRQG